MNTTVPTRVGSYAAHSLAFRVPARGQAGGCPSIEPKHAWVGRRLPLQENAEGPSRNEPD